MSECDVRITRLTVAPKGQPLFSELATHIEITDEAAGEFVVVKQQRDAGTDQSVAIEPGEWLVLRDAIGRMVAECRGDRVPDA